MEGGGIPPPPLGLSATSKKLVLDRVKENWIRRREHQRRAIEAYVSGKGVFPSSSTESVKSYAFQVAPYVSDYFEIEEREIRVN